MRTMKTIALATGILLGSNAVSAQTVFIPGGTSGIGTITTGVGVFTNTPVPAGAFDVQGDVRLNGTSAGDDGVWFTSPGGEKGLSIFRSGISNRADVRFDGLNLRLVAGTGTSVPYNGITISAYGGKVGIGTNPFGANQLEVDCANSGLADGILSTVNGTAAIGYGTSIKGVAENNQFNNAIVGQAYNGTRTTAFEGTASGATSSNTAVKGTASGGSQALGADFDASGSNFPYGVKARSTGNSTTSGMSRAGDFNASGAQVNKGIQAIATGSNNLLNYAVDARAESSTDVTGNTAVQAFAISPGTSTRNIGIYASISGGNAATSYAGYFMGSPAPGPGGTMASNAAYFNGGIVASGSVFILSDRKFKENILDVKNALEKIEQLSAKTYTFKGRDQFPSFNFSSGKQYGFIAQEVEKVIPELVSEVVNPAQYDLSGNKVADDVSYKAVNYTLLIPILTAAIQEQQGMITELKEKITRLESNNPSAIGSNNHSATGAMLYQNTPNPFDSYTEIRYVLPQNYTHAKLMVFDMNGKQLRDIALQGAGEGKTQLSSAELAAGMYLYSLVVDGKEVDTKRMILSGK